MNKKIFAIFIIVLIIVLGLSLSPSLAKNNKDADIPEEDGIYDMPGHPELKVRVFVHHVGKGKPVPPTPVLQCGLDDPQSLAVVDKEAWKLPSEWTYNLNPGSVPDSIGVSSLPIIAERVFNEWEGAINNKVDVVRGADTAITRKSLDGVNIVAWGKASPGALGVTYIWYYPSTGEVAELDTIMNKTYFWKWSDSTTCAYTESYDAQNILTHEIGHWFGLDDEYATEYKDNTMYGYGAKWEVKKNTLTDGDIDGVKIIYSN